MSPGIPADSTDARERRELERDQGTTAASHDTRCVDGWLGEDTAGHPIACPACRPHVAASRRRTRRQLYGWPA